MTESDQSTAPAASIFRRSLPITATSFINKCGDIGIRLFPMLLVEQNIPIDHSSIIMTLVKGTSVIAAFAGGWAGDKLGHRASILLSFVLTAIGMLSLSMSRYELTICLAAMLCTFGQGIFAAPLRLLVVQSLAKSERQEGLAWLRSANNGAVMVANAIAYLTSGIGLTALFLFDGLTSLIAFIYGLKFLPRTKSLISDSKYSAKSQTSIEAPPARWGAFVAVTLLIAFFAMCTELFFVSTAAQAKISFGHRGVEVYSQVYILNTSLCMLLTVFASKWFRRAKPAFCLGILLQGAGLSVFWLMRETMTAYFAGALLSTLGELAFTAVGQHLLLHLLPGGKREARIYSAALVVQLLGKTAGGGLAFYFLQGSAYWLCGLWVGCVLAAGITLALPQDIQN